MNQVPSGERVHIGIFGKRNAGKSSLLNAISSQEAAIVSDTPGTTTDPVKRTMELLPLGPVVFIDTPGIDDEGELGQLRVESAKKMLHQVDMALLVLDGVRALDTCELEIKAQLEARNIPYVVVYNRREQEFCELSGEFKSQKLKYEMTVSAMTGYHVKELRDLLAALMPEVKKEKPIVSDLISPGDLVILVVPIDEAAPKGRVILPQQLVLREILDCHARALVVQDTELKETLSEPGKRPALVITDSQVFSSVMKLVPEDIPLTSFSILMARKKGNLDQLVQGARTLDCLKPGDKVLISEGCTHHRQCNDIGTVKLPNWIVKHCGVECEFAFSSGQSFPDHIEDYKLVVHCGGCMLNDQEMGYRQQQAILRSVPMTNYGTAIAHMNGILERSLKVFE